MLKKLKLNSSMKTYKTFKINTPKICHFHYRGLVCNSRKSRNTWSNRQVWPWSTEWSRAKANRVLPKEDTGHSKHPLPKMQEKTLHMDITRWSILKARQKERAQSYLTLCDPMDCSPPGSSVHGYSPGKNTGVGCHVLLQEISPTQRLNSGLPHCRQILYCLSYQG